MMTAKAITFAALRKTGYDRVGVPALKLRIAEAIGNNNPDGIPLKSLQRFLAARIGTSAGENFGSSRHSSDFDG